MNEESKTISPCLSGQAVVGHDLAFDELLDDVVDRRLLAQVALDIRVILELVRRAAPTPTSGLATTG